MIRYSFCQQVSSFHRRQHMTSVYMVDSPLCAGHHMSRTLMAPQRSMASSLVRIDVHNSSCSKHRSYWVQERMRFLPPSNKGFYPTSLGLSKGKSAKWALYLLWRPRPQVATRLSPFTSRKSWAADSTLRTCLPLLRVVPHARRVLQYQLSTKTEPSHSSSSFRLKINMWVDCRTKLNADIANEFLANFLHETREEEKKPCTLEMYNQRIYLAMCEWITATADINEFMFCPLETPPLIPLMNHIFQLENTVFPNWNRVPYFNYIAITIIVTAISLTDKARSIFSS